MLDSSASGQELQGLIRDIQSGFSAFYASVLTPRDVSMAQFAVLVCLTQQQPRKMSEIARTIHITLPGVTHLVDRLEERRMVRRMAHPKDRRVNLIELTATGRELLTKTQGKAARMMTQNYLRHSVSQRSAILKFLEGMRRGVQGLAENSTRTKP